MKWITFCKGHVVLLISALAALLSMLLVPPNKEYLGYIDVSVLILLFCLMGVVAGLRKIGVFQQIASVFLNRVKTVRRMAFLMMNLCFFASMFVTNDVALITFVPLTCSIFEQTTQKKSLLRTVVLEAAAANLGSMMTPIGNPQNLYLYTHYDFSMLSFLKTMLPIGVVSYILLLLSLLLIETAPLNVASGTVKKGSIAPKKRPFLVIYLLLAVLCLMTVAGWIPHLICFGIVVLVLLIADRTLLLRVDWELLLTFVCFFIFSGNLQHLDVVQTAMEYFLSGNVTLTAALVSQCISNVPAAILLSGFTETGRELLLGVNIGGLGTPVASLASLIAYQYYAKSKLAETGKYMLWFLTCNFAGLLLLLAVQWGMDCIFRL